MIKVQKEWVGPPVPPSKKLKELLRDMSLREIQSTSMRIKSIIEMKKNKIKLQKSMMSQQVIQPTLIPCKSHYPPFSTESPISTNIPFLSQKVKRNIIAPDRIYNHSPNVKVGVPLTHTSLLEEDPQVVGRKLQQYSLTVDDQDGQLKNRRLKQREWMSGHKNQKYTRMKRTLFGKFVLDKYNFYDPPPSQPDVAHPSQCTTLKKSRSIKAISLSKSKEFQKCPTQQTINQLEQFYFERSARPRVKLSVQLPNRRTSANNLGSEIKSIQNIPKQKSMNSYADIFQK